MKNNVAVIGNGKIGKIIASLLKSEYFNVTVADQDTSGSDCIPIDASDEKQIEHFLKGKDVVVSAAPYFLNKKIAYVASEMGVAYFDLTEDTDVTSYIKNLDTKTFMMPQCGLAPGAVNIIGSNLTKEFEEVHDVQMRVGALPRYPSNEMSYYLTWSTNGLINEYCNLCDAIVDGQKLEIPPLTGVERIYIDGRKYEAFNTSGGVATMCETFDGKVQNLSYKTIRYPGHRDRMNFLLQDLGLKRNRDKIADLFDQQVPYTTEDVVVMLVKVIGISNGKLIERSYQKSIFGQDGMSAIQRSTASGVCAIVLAYCRDEITGEGFIKQEDINWETFINNKFGQVYSK
jgi:saccharopine dehydrogenase-like NADP-dependent oxidoreductase